MKSLKRVMIINWRWEEEFEYFSNISEELLNQFLSLGGIKTVPVYEFKKYSETPHEDELESLIIPTNFIFSDTSEIEKFENEFFKPICSFIDTLSGKNVSQVDILFLLHRKQGFENLIESLSERERNDLKFEFFGGGKAIIYEASEGILSHAGGTFFNSPTMDMEEDAGKFDDDLEGIAIKQSRFNRIWDHYWYSTKRKIELLTKEILISQIEYCSEEHKAKTKQRIGNFLLHIGCMIPEYPDEEIIGDWDFWGCLDLSNKIESFEGKENLIKNLNKVLLEDFLLDDHQSLNHSLRALINDWASIDST